MTQSTTKARKKSRTGGSVARRRERRFSTSAAYIQKWVAWVGMAGALVLGAGVFGLWILDPPFAYASYLVAAGGLGLGVALWFGQPSESSVAIGDAGIAVEDGRDGARVHWFEIESLRVEGDQLIARGKNRTVQFSVGANPKAAAWALKEAAERVPSVVDVQAQVASRLPAPEPKAGLETDVEDDQLAGSRCAKTDQLITLEEDARLCKRCGQIYHRAGVPAQCVSCELELQGNTLRA